MRDLLRELAAEWQVSIDVLASRARVTYSEARTLVVAEVAPSGKQHQLGPKAAQAWALMRTAASKDGIEIFILSAFRSIERQAEIVRRKYSSGLPIDQILMVSALPGYSEHHTGRAVDVGTVNSRPLDEEFEKTLAYQWLATNAAAFDFRLSYPRGNADGYVYEPWHWCYRDAAVQGRT